MAERAVTFLLGQLTPFLFEELGLVGAVREEAEYIRDELERIRAFLREADSMEDSDSELRVWVKQVQDVAYDAEDVLDQFVLRLRRRDGSGFYSFLRNISHSIKTLRTRHRIASEVRRLKSRVIGISEGHQRYRYKFSVSGQGSSSTALVEKPWHDRRSDALLLDEAELVGIDKPKNQLIAWLVVEDLNFRAVSVVGMGGLGKTTLVKKVYDDIEVKRHFESHAWITVSQSFETRDLLKDLIQQLHDEIELAVPESLEKMDRVKLKSLVRKLLQERRYVIVLDDVWSVDAWDAFKYALPNNKCGSRVLLTTRIVDVASTSCVESQGNLYTMQALSAQESWSLFCRKTFQGYLCPPHLKEISLGILEKCQGLPLAIVTISGVFATKDERRIHEWEMVCRSLADGVQGNNKLGSLWKILSLSYSDLPYYLKICFLYLSIFPEDYLIERMRLIRLWSAEGFVEEKEGKTVEEVAEGYLVELINRSLVQVAEMNGDGSVRICRIHDLLREIVLSKSKEDNLVAVAGKGDRTSWPEKVRRLSIHYSMGNVQVLPNRRFSRLRSLLMFEVAQPLSRTLMRGLLTGGGSTRLLKVLDLRGASLERIPDEVFKLFYLKYLSLRETKVKTIPNSIGNLENLETLDLKHAYVTELPVQILKLQRLRHLLVYRYGVKGYMTFHITQCFKTPRGIGNLVNLQKLCHVVVNKGDGRAVIGELGKMTQLRRLGIDKLRREDGKTLCSSIEKMSNLRALSLGSLEEEEILDIQSINPAPRLLQRLHLRGRLEKLPNWIYDLRNLVRLALGWNRLGEDPLQSLQHLPNLADLQLRAAYEGEGLHFRAGGFQKLKILKLSELGVRWVIVEKGAMPHLEEFVISICNLVEEVPSGIQYLTRLKKFALNDMPDKLIETLDPTKGGDYWKIAHIPLVVIASYRDDTWRRYALEGHKTVEVQ